MSKFNFNFVVSALSEYTDENTGLIKKAILGSRTLEKGGLNVITGAKHDIKLNAVENGLFLQAGGSCGRSVSGTTTFSQQTVVVNPIVYHEDLCPQTFWVKWQSQLMKDGTTPDDFPFSQFIYDYKVDELKKEVEKQIWQADEVNGTGNLVLTDGFGAFMSGKTDSSYVATASGVTTAATAIAQVNAMIAGVPEAVAMDENLTLYMSITDWKLFIDALTTANLYHYNPLDAKDFVYYYKGVKVMATPGLTGTNFWYLFVPSMVSVVTDLEDELDNITVLWNPYTFKIQVDMAYKLGVGTGDPAMITHNNPNLG